MAENDLLHFADWYQLLLPAATLRMSGGLLGKLESETSIRADGPSLLAHGIIDVTRKAFQSHLQNPSHTPCIWDSQMTCKGGKFWLESAITRASEIYKPHFSLARKNIPFPTASRSGGSPQWSDSFRGAPYALNRITSFKKTLLYAIIEDSRAYLLDVLLDPIIVSIHAVSPYVWLLRYEVAILQ